MSPDITVRALADLARFAPPDGRLEIASGETVGAVAARLGLDPARIGTALVGGRPVEPTTPLSPGDELVFVPPITGG